VGLTYARFNRYYSDPMKNKLLMHEIAMVVKSQTENEYIAMAIPSGR
jgi:hypothetical protein